MSEVRKRISRACDSCNALRTKCDGGHPCQHCLDSNVPCEFKRLRKKRGKAARRDLEVAVENRQQHQQQQQTPRSYSVLTNAHAEPHGDRIVLPAIQSGHAGSVQNIPPNHSQANQSNYPTMSHEWVMNLPSPASRTYDSQSMNAQYNLSAQRDSPSVAPGGPFNYSSPGVRSTSGNLNNYIPGGSLPPTHPYNLPPPGSRPTSLNGGDLSMSNLNRIFGPSESPQSVSTGYGQSIGQPRRPSERAKTSASSEHRQLKYPILAPYLRTLDFIPVPVLNDLLEKYFDNSPYVMGYVVRRASVLHKIQPRRTSPGLLYSLLCVAAHTCENSFFSDTPVTRAKIVQRLFEMSVTALRPLQHDEVGGGGLDDVITYMQLGTIIAASEFKGVSLRWFYAAWTLAKELRLNRELSGVEAATTSEVAREERRRTWWLLYMIDRHLCLCYNKPLSFNDIECAQLFRPLSDARWESDEDLDGAVDAWPVGAETEDTTQAHNLSHLYEARSRGPGLDVQGPGIFGFFLPLMFILGEICTLTMLSRSHLLVFTDLEPQKAQIRSHLDTYYESLTPYLVHLNGNGKDGGPAPSYPDQAFVAYALQLMHTMHILLCGKWDPIVLMEDNDQWISSKEFVQAATHAVSAAEAIKDILRVDPDLAFMPFFFGIYLLQGSFLLLLIVDKLDQESDEAVIQAAETYIRAHEVCVVTLDTQYQRNFRRVMRSTLNSIRQKIRSSDEERTKRREILALYRWANDGRGLVI